MSIVLITKLAIAGIKLVKKIKDFDSDDDFEPKEFFSEILGLVEGDEGKRQEVSDLLIEIYKILK